jgi:hypothetical protein
VEAIGNSIEGAFQDSLGCGPGRSPISANLRSDFVANEHGMRPDAFVPKGQHDSSLARSAWEIGKRHSRPSGTVEKPDPVAGLGTVPRGRLANSRSSRRK